MNRPSLVSAMVLSICLTRRVRGMACRSVVQDHIYRIVVRRLCFLGFLSKCFTTKARRTR